MTEDTLQNEELKDNVNENIESNSEINVEDNFMEVESNSELVKVKLELEESKDKFLRLFAEFENFKKRTLKERLDLIKSASQDTMAAMLPVLDDFERAKKASEAENSTEVFSEGVNLVYHKFLNTLEARGLKIMESTGDVFDVEKHEALTEIPAPNPELVGKVIDTIERGYYLNDKIIRYAKVVVGK